MTRNLTNAAKGAISALLVAGGLGVTSAHSATMVTTWDYLIESGFSNYTSPAGPGAVTGSNTSSLGAPYVTTLSWGTLGSGGQLSSLVIEDNVAPGTSSPDPGAAGPTPRTDLVTNGGVQNGATITHNNFAITNFQNALTSTLLTSELTLTSLTPPVVSGIAIGPLNIVYQILFEETSNVSSPCVVPGTACSDIFVAKLFDGDSFENLPGQIDTAIGVFEGYAYTLSLIFTGLQNLTAAQCAAAGAAAGCQGFITAEGQSNYFTPTFKISAVEVPNETPEPGSLALLGALAAGFGAMRMRRK